MKAFKRVFRKRKVFLSGMVPLLFGASSAVNAVIIYVLIVGMSSIQADLPARLMEQLFQYSFYSIKGIAFMGLSFYVLIQVLVWWPAYVSVFWDRMLKVIGVILGGVWALQVFSSQISEVLSDPVILKVLITGVVLGILGKAGESMLQKCQEVTTHRGRSGRKGRFQEKSKGIDAMKVEQKMDHMKNEKKDRKGMSCYAAYKKSLKQEQDKICVCDSKGDKNPLKDSPFGDPI